MTADDRLLTEVMHAHGVPLSSLLTLTPDDLVGEIAALRYQDALTRARDLYHLSKERTAKIRAALTSEHAVVRLAGAFAHEWVQHDAAQAKQAQAARKDRAKLKRAERPRRRQKGGSDQ